MDDFSRIFRCKSARTFREIEKELRRPLVIDKTGKVVRRKPKKVEPQISKEISKVNESNTEEETVDELARWETSFSLPDWVSQTLRDNGFASLVDVGRAWRWDTYVLVVLLKTCGYDIDKALCFRLRNAFSEAEKKYVDSNEELKFNLELSFFRAKFVDEKASPTAEPERKQEFDAPSAAIELDNSGTFIPPPLLVSKSAPISNFVDEETVNSDIKSFTFPNEFSRQSSESEVSFDLVSLSESSSILEELYDQGILSIEAFQKLRQHGFESAPLQNMKSTHIRGQYENGSFSPPPFLRSASTYMRSPSIKSVGSDRTRSFSQLVRPLPQGLKTHVFLAHTWMDDELGRNNHNRVSQVNDELRRRGFITWFDATELSGDIRQTMADGLHSTCCVILFITKGYEKKINSNNQKDNCFYEFGVITVDEGLVNRRIPVAMEKSMVDPKNWQKARLKAELGAQLILDFSEDFEGDDDNLLIQFQGKMDELEKRIVEEVEKVFVTEGNETTDR